MPRVQCGLLPRKTRPCWRGPPGLLLSVLVSSLLGFSVPTPRPLWLLIQAAASVSHAVHSQQLPGLGLAHMHGVLPSPALPSPGLTSARRGCSWAGSCPSGWRCAESQPSLRRAGTAAHPRTGWGSYRTRQETERWVSGGAGWHGPRMEMEEPREPALRSTSHTPRSGRGTSAASHPRI